MESRDVKEKGVFDRWSMLKRCLQLFDSDLSCFRVPKVWKVGFLFGHMNAKTVRDFISLPVLCSTTWHQLKWLPNLNIYASAFSRSLQIY